MSNIRAGDTQLLPGSAFPANQGWPTNKAFSSPALRSKKSVSGAPRYSTFLLTPLSPPTQLLAAALCPHQCQCHCHHRAQRAPTLPLTFPLTKRVPWSFSRRLFRDMARSESKPCSPAVGNPPLNQSRLAGHSNQTSLPRYPLFEKSGHSSHQTPQQQSPARSKPRKTGSSVNRRRD